MLICSKKPKLNRTIIETVMLADKNNWNIRVYSQTVVADVTQEVVRACGDW